jgi:acyl-CoA synthetase (NDP forming)
LAEPGRKKAALNDARIDVETLKQLIRLANEIRIIPLHKYIKMQEMLQEIRASALLEGVRGKPPVDLEVLVDAILRIAQLVQDFPIIAELDINPFIVYEQGQGGIAIDMRLILESGDRSNNHSEQTDSGSSS